MSLLSWLRPPSPLDSTTAATRAWLAVDAEARAEQSAREQLAHWKAAYEAERGDRLVAEASAVELEKQVEALLQRLPQTSSGGGDTSSPRPGPPPPDDTTARDAATVERSERYGAEIGQRDRAAAIDTAVQVLTAHSLGPWQVVCRCGWEGALHTRHVAEQLAATGVLRGAS